MKEQKFLPLLSVGAIIVPVFLFLFVFSARVALAAAPDTLIDSGPAASTTDATPTLTFLSNDSPVTFECSLVSAGSAVSYAACTSPYVAATLPVGSYTFTVRATNAGVETDASPATRTFSVVDFASGDGSAESPYQIATCNQLLEIDLDLAAHYQLSDDINCNGVTFAPIGSGETPFTGALDGRGYVVRHLSITGDALVGMFAMTSGATIQNLGMQYGAIAGSVNVGALTGYGDMSSMFTNVHIYDTTVTSTGGYVGGITGFFGNSSVISRSLFVGGSVSSPGEVYVGGLAADFQGAQIQDSYTKTNIVGNSAGGLVGTMGAADSSITRSYSISTFTTLGTTNGGLVGSFDAGSVTNSFSASDLTVGGGTNIGGLFGSGTGTSTNNVFDATKAGRTNCAGTGSPLCTAINVGNADPNYFINNDSNAPLETWSFHGTSNPWHTNYNDYPTLTPIYGVIIQCDAGTRTLTSIHGSCEYIETGWGTTTWEVQYKAASDADWTNITLDDNHVATATVPGASPYVEYQMRFRLTNDSGENFWATVDFALPDTDDDGVNDVIENLGPASGDANDDGTWDREQANVFTGITEDQRYFVLQTSCENNFNVQIGNEPAADHADTNFDYPFGLVGFVGRNCGAPGSAVTVTLYFYGEYDLSTTVLRKYSNGTYSTIDGATLTSVTIGGVKALKASYVVVDGGPLDSDGLADGNIVDPVGIAQSTVAAPDTGLRPTVAMPYVLSLIFGLVSLAYAARRIATAGRLQNEAQ